MRQNHPARFLGILLDPFWRVAGGHPAGLACRTG
jgi:hypothetical protein